jgi:RNA polymerase sigma-70 factor (ECF subfamily)
MYRVHRSTAARQVARTRDALLAATRRALMARLHIGRREFESIMRLISSQLDVSVATFLDGEREAEDPPDGAGA